MIDFQTEYTKDLHNLSDYPKIDFELIRKHFKNWEHHKEDDIMTYRNQSFSSAVTGTEVPELKNSLVIPTFFPINPNVIIIFLFQYQLLMPNLISLRLLLFEV